MLVIDPGTGTCSTIACGVDGDGKWFGIASGSDGKLYCAPHNASGVLVIVCENTENSNKKPDYLTDKQAQWYLDFYGDLKNAFGTDLVKAKNHWVSYGIKEGREWLKDDAGKERKNLVTNISNLSDSASGTCSTIACGVDGNSKWLGIAAGSDGKLYCAPHTASGVLVIDPASGTCSTIACGVDGNNKWYGIAAGSDGKLYCAPAYASHVLTIQPAVGSPASLSAATQRLVDLDDIDYDFAALQTTLSPEQAAPDDAPSLLSRLVLTPGAEGLVDNLLEKVPGLATGALQALLRVRAIDTERASSIITQYGGSIDFSVIAKRKLERKDDPERRVGARVLCEIKSEVNGKSERAANEELDLHTTFRDL